MKSKKNGEFAHLFVQSVIEESVRCGEEYRDIDSKLEQQL